MSDDLVERLRNSGSRTDAELHEDREEAADRIEADAKRITELALDALAAGTQAEEAYQAQLAAEARVKVLEDALRKVRELNMTGTDEDGHRWAHSDLIEQEIARVVPEGEK